MLDVRSLIRLAALGTVALAGFSASGAQASLAGPGEFCDPETSECPPPGPPPGPPPLPSLPTQSVSTYGTIFIQRGTV
ncbi:MAG: hypothetical protein H7267_07585 [Sandarakinorhabdus sp.]|nr:hypothetical protein [Sandarakinorhabdus sp.]